jgi:hypothetical protein
MPAWAKKVCDPISMEKSWMLWYMPVIPVMGKLKIEELPFRLAWAKS